MYFLAGPTSQLDIVSLASQVPPATTTLTDAPPDGITGALKMVTLDATYKDKAYAGVFFPPAQFSSTPGSPAQGGLFGGVRGALRSGVGVAVCGPRACGAVVGLRNCRCSVQALPSLVLAVRI